AGRPGAGAGARGQPPRAVDRRSAPQPDRGAGVGSVARAADRERRAGDRAARAALAAALRGRGRSGSAPPAAGLGERVGGGARRRRGADDRRAGADAMSEIVQPPIAITAAHDLSPRAIATFSPLVQRGSRLLVPVQLDALVVRGTGTTFADVTMATPGDDGAAGALQTPPFTDRTREPGVYLHWALPDALTRG